MPAWSNVAVAHLNDLGMTAVELLPVNEACRRRPGCATGEPTCGATARLLLRAEPAYSSAVAAEDPGEQMAEFKQMVEAMHEAGIEVILDMVFNHTAEGDDTGPTLCFRGLDNPSYYRLDPATRGSTLDHDRLRELAERGWDPLTLQLIMDSLRVLDPPRCTSTATGRPGSHPGPPGG